MIQTTQQAQLKLFQPTILQVELFQLRQIHERVSFNRPYRVVVERKEPQRGPDTGVEVGTPDGRQAVRGQIDPLDAVETPEGPLLDQLEAVPG